MNLELIHTPLTNADIFCFTERIGPLGKFSLCSWQDKFVLNKVASLLPPNSIVVEIGTYVGGGAAIIAHANPFIEIHTYDIYDTRPYGTSHYETLEQSLGVCECCQGPLPRTLKNVAKSVERYTNIHLHQVDKDEVIKFDRPVDLFIEDSSHWNPQLAFSLSNWLPKIKVGGILMLHDFRPWSPNMVRRHPDVEGHVELLSNDEKWKYLGPVTNDLFLKDPTTGQPSSYAIFQRV